MLYRICIDRSKISRGFKLVAEVLHCKAMNDQAVRDTDGNLDAMITRTIQFIKCAS